MPHSAQTHSKPRGSACSRHENLRKKYKKKEQHRGKNRGKEEGGLQWERLCLLWCSQIAVSLPPSVSLCFKKKGERKKSRAPQSLGTAASQILVLNDVRSMAFVESHSLCSALETQSWDSHRRCVFRQQTRGTGSHRHLSIQRAGGGGVKSCMCWLWIPQDGSSYSCWSLTVWGWGGKICFFFFFFFLNRKSVKCKLNTSAGGWFGFLMSASDSTTTWPAAESFGFEWGLSSL